MTWLLSIASIAWGQECPRPFTEFDVRSTVRESNEGINRSDVLAHKRMWSEFLSRVPCLDAQLPKDSWANFLLNEAIVRRGTGEPNWEAPLATALQIYPDLPTVPQFMLDEFVRPPPPATSELVVPEDAALFVDGVLVREVPVLQGEHVVQVWRDQRWRSALVIDATPPADWLVPKAPEIVEVERVEEVWEPMGRGAVGLLVGFVVTTQLVEDPGTFLADGRQYAGLSGFATHGVQPVAVTGGFFWDAVVPIVAPSIRTNAETGGFSIAGAAPAVPLIYVGPAAVLKEVHFGIGGGVFRLTKVEGNVPIGVWLPQPHVAFGVRRDRTDFEIGGGATNTALHAGMRGGWLLAEPKAISWRLGLDAHLGAGFFFEEPPGERRATVLQLGLLGRFDATWGRAKGGGAL